MRNRASDCYSCWQSQRPDAPPSERIHVEGGWRVAHANTTSLRGWLLIIPLRHVTRLADLDPAEAATFGPLLCRVSAAIQDVVGCPKTYVLQFAEAVPHVHFHVVPRMPDFRSEDVGPGAFRFLQAEERDRVSQQEMDQAAAEIRPRLVCRMTEPEVGIEPTA
jgi:diadenosine tetraphosphate (Ap4A) HIT family hydrolase